MKYQTEMQELFMIVSSLVFFLRVLPLFFYFFRIYSAAMIIRYNPCKFIFVLHLILTVTYVVIFLFITMILAILSKKYRFGHFHFLSSLR